MRRRKNILPGRTRSLPARSGAFGCCYEQANARLAGAPAAPKTSGLGEVVLFAKIDAPANAEWNV